MSFFNDDSFFGGGIDELFRKLAGDGYVEYSASGPEGKKVFRKKRTSGGKLFLERVVSGGKIYFLFDLSGKKNISTKIVDESYEDERGRIKHSKNQVLEIFEGEELIFEFLLGDVNKKGFETKFNNGILEVAFRK